MFHPETSSSSLIIIEMMEESRRREDREAQTHRFVADVAASDT